MTLELRTPDTPGKTNFAVMPKFRRSSVMTYGSPLAVKVNKVLHDVLRHLASRHTHESLTCVSLI